jgi:nucleotide-binding universal stress UspA family protein
MYERILVPLDGSKVGESGLHYIEDMVSHLSPEVKVEVTLFHVITSLARYAAEVGLGVPINYAEEELEAAKQQAMNYLDKAGEGLRSKGAVVNTKVNVGDAAEKIIETAEEMKADLVAMSTHGRSGLRRWAFGSVAEKVLRAGTTPILTVRAAQDISNE